jgi:hypothetical protein
LTLLQPSQLLQKLASNLKIQTYLEDSQFGLLKTSLTLAGERFVVDIDLEVDALGGNEEGEEDTEGPSTAGIGDKGAGVGVGERGKVKLSRLVGNYVNLTGGTGKGEWIGQVLGSHLERYLSIWNQTESGMDTSKNWDRLVRLESSIRGLEDELRDLKGLDDHASTISQQETGEQVDWFAELEELSGRVKQFIDGDE